MDFPADQQRPRDTVATAAGRSFSWWAVFRRRLRQWIVLVAASVICVLVGLMFFEEKLIFIPTRYPAGDWRPAGLAVEDVWFSSPSSGKLHGWYLPCKRPTAVVLFCHGNAGNVTHRAIILRQLRDVAKVSVLVFDYGGYGRSEGSPGEQSILADARAARAWLARREGIAETEIVLLGESIGGAVAVDLAAADGARALVLEHTFDSLPNTAAYHFPWLPVRWLMRTRLNSVDKIANYRGPLWQSHGDADTIVPYRLGRALFEAANEPKQFLTEPGVDHNDLRGRDYYEALRRFLESLPQPVADPSRAEK